MDYLAIQRKRRIKTAIKTTIISTIVVFFGGWGLFSYVKMQSLFSEYDLYINTITLKSDSVKTKLSIPQSQYFTKVNECYILGALLLEKITVPHSLQKLSIQDCPRLQELNISKQVYSMYVSRCKSIKEISIPDSVMLRTEDSNIDELYDSLAFSTSYIYILECDSLESLAIGKNHTVNVIGGCPELESITFSGPVYSLSIKLCDKLSKIYLSDDFTAYEIYYDKSVTFVVSKGSDAEQFAIEHELDYTYK